MSMNMADSLNKKIKYHSLAIIPTIIGLCILVLGFHLLFIEAVVNIDEAINLTGESTMSDGEKVADAIRKNSSPFIGTFLIVIGYMTHRFGRMYIKMRFKDSGTEDLSGSEKEPELMIDADDYED